MRKLIRIFCLLCALLGSALATLPWWLGSVTNLLLQPLGGRVSTYERIGYSRFALNDVTVIRGQTSVKIARVEAPTPLLWAWRHWRGKDATIVVSRWSVRVADQPGETDVHEGWVELRPLLLHIARGLGKWAPSVTLGPGEVGWQKQRLVFGAARWERTILSVQKLQWSALAGDATVVFVQNEDQIQVRARLADSDLSLDLKNRGANVRGTVLFRELPAALEAEFAPDGWLPREAHLVLTEGKLKGALIPHAERYQTIELSARADWTGGQLTFRGQGSGVPVFGEQVPPIKLEAEGKAGHGRVEVSQLDVKIPGLSAQLTHPLVIDAEGRLISGDTSFVFTAKLDALSLAGAKGEVEGEVQLKPRPSGWPAAVFRLSTSGFSYAQTNLESMKAAGVVEWPKMRLDQAKLVPTKGDEVTLDGTYDFGAREVIEGIISGHLSPAGVETWIPPKVSFAGLKFAGRFHGPFLALEHQGEIQVENATMPNLRPLNLGAHWQGKGAAIASFELRASAGPSALLARGRWSGKKLKVEAFTWSRGNETLLSLQRPTEINWEDTTIEVQPIELANRGRSFSISGGFGPKGKIEIAARNIESGLWQDFVSGRSQNFRVTALGFTGDWDRGPLRFAVELNADFPFQTDQILECRVRAAGDRKSVTLEELRVFSGKESVAAFSGNFPLSIRPSDAPLVFFDGDAPLSLDGSVNGSAEFWRLLATATGATVVAPRLELHVKGSALAPQGEIDLTATSISVDPNRSALPLPAFTEIQIHAVATRDGIVAGPMECKIEGQELKATARLPLHVTSWIRFQAAPWEFLAEEGEAEIDIPGADLAPVGERLKLPLVRKGTLVAHAAVKRGEWNGSIQLSDATTSPIGGMGAFQNVRANIAVTGRQIRIASLSGVLGGQVLTLDGTAALPLEGSATYDLHLQGKGIPLVRREGFLVRTDIDARLVTGDKGTPTISGKLRLQHGLFFSDVRAFFQSGGTSAAQRPPYFAVETAPFKNWQLDLNVDGDRFLRVRTTVFNGVVSAHFRLLGSLGEPRAIGQATITDGQILFPFASFDVQQGVVRLTEAKPYEPELLLTGTSQRYNYELRLEAAGAASSPVVTFTSSPSLTSDQILLMVMAGEVPQSELNTTSTQRLAAVGSYLGQSLLNVFGAGDSGSDRLSVATGERISAQGRETYRCEYRLDKRWSLVGEYDEFDEYNIGLKWRLLHKETPPDAKR